MIRKTEEIFISVLEDGDIDLIKQPLKVDPCTDCTGDRCSYRQEDACYEELDYLDYKNELEARDIYQLHLDYHRFNELYDKQFEIIRERNLLRDKLKPFGLA